MSFAGKFMAGDKHYPKSAPGQVRVINGQGETVSRHTTRDAAYKKQKALQKRTGRRYYVKG